jgi:hypothetical protein
MKRQPEAGFGRVRSSNHSAPAQCLSDRPRRCALHAHRRPDQVAGDGDPGGAGVPAGGNDHDVPGAIPAQTGA